MLDKFRPISKRRGDYSILLVSIGLCLLGLLLISSASVVKSYEEFGSNNVYLLKQLTFLVIGSIAMIVTSVVDYRLWRKYALYILIGSVVLLLAVHLPFGISISGARRWIEIGPLLFQPSELMKLSFIIYLSAWLAIRGKEITNFSKGVFPVGVLIGLIIILMMSQKDLGTTLVITTIGGILVFISGALLTHLSLGLFFGVSIFYGLIKVESYRWQRMLTFLNPTADIQGAGYQINQALIAIGSGGLWGLGFGQSRQKYLYLPQVQTDMIFAIIAEELGYIRVAFILLAILFLVFKIYSVAKSTTDDFGKLVCVGIGSWILIQTLFNIAGVMGIVPLTGIPIPFLSYGGSSLLILLMGIGIVYNVSKSVPK